MDKMKETKIDIYCSDNTYQIIRIPSNNQLNKLFELVKHLTSNKVPSES